MSRTRVGVACQRLVWLWGSKRISNTLLPGSELPLSFSKLRSMFSVSLSGFLPFPLLGASSDSTSEGQVGLNQDKPGATKFQHNFKPKHETSKLQSLELFQAPAVTVLLSHPSPAPGCKLVFSGKTLKPLVKILKPQTIAFGMDKQ